MRYRVDRGGKTYEFDVELTAEGWRVRGTAGEELIRFDTRSDGSRRAIMTTGELEIWSARRGAETWARAGDKRLAARVERVRPSADAASNRAGIGALTAPMAGKLLRLDVAVGARVEAGQPLAVIEAMKMENEIVAPMAGVVIEVAATAPSAVEKGALLVKVEAE